MYISPTTRHWLEFLLAMTKKEIKARYKHAVLGFLWVLLNPLLQMAVIGFVFQFFVPVQVDNYFLFLFAGLLPWNFFSYSVLKATSAIVYERSLIQKAKFPREAIVLSIVLSNLFHFLISLSLLLAILLFWRLSQGLTILGLAHFLIAVIGLVPVIVGLTVLTSGLSLLTSALNVRYRDVSFIVQAVMPLWFYATPLIYSLNLLPENLRWLFYLNPVTFLIELFHWVLLGVVPESVFGGLLSLVLVLVISILGSWVFHRKSAFFDDWI